MREGITLKVYLDNCCFNRPYDDQLQLRIYLEAQAKLQIQKEILQGKHELVWSFILEYENEQNPFDIRKMAIRDWKDVAKQTVTLNETIAVFARKLLEKGIKNKDALHISCAVYAGCDVFFTTDKKLLRTPIAEIKTMNPLDYI